MTIHNSRMAMLKAQQERNTPTQPTNTSRGVGRVLETPYKPGFVEEKDLESVKMAVDKELSTIANAFQVTTERTADTIKRIESVQIEGEGVLAKIEQVDKVSKEGDVALAERITKLQADVDINVKAAIEEEARVRADADGALAERITTLKAESDAGDATLTQEMTVVSTNLGKVEAKWGVSMDVNGKVSGVSMNNDGDSSEFNIVADKFRISDGTNDNVPFEVVGKNTRIKSALVDHIQSDNWDATNGWAINKDGDAIFRNGQFKGEVRADSGYFKGELQAATGSFTGAVTATSGSFTGTINADSGTLNNVTVSGVVNASGGDFNNVRINENCVVLGTLYADKVVGLPTGKSFGPLSGNIGGGEYTLVRLDLPSAEGRFNMRGLLGGLPQGGQNGGTSGSATVGFKVYVNGGLVFQQAVSAQGSGLTGVPNLAGRSFNYGSNGGTVEIRAWHDGGRSEGRVYWGEGFLYTAIDR